MSGANTGGTTSHILSSTRTASSTGCSLFTVPFSGKMPSPRSPAMRPTSPLTPTFKASPQFDTLPPSTQRPAHSRTHSGQRRTPNKSLKLPSLPRFHPANFPSAQGSNHTTPDGQSPPQPPISPRAHQRMFSNAQKQLYFNQREMLSAAVRGTSPNHGCKPNSPRLQPLGSPGPVTPLELEAEDGYLLAGARGATGTTAASEQLMEKLINQETRRVRSAGQGARPPSR